MFKDAAMNLREWSTNSKQVNSLIPEKDKAESETIKVLGHLWNTADDTLSLKESTELDKSMATSKRSVLKQIASVYDPLGLICPIVLPGKVLMQELWSKKLDWDDNLTPDDISTWKAVKEELLKIPGVKIPRCITLQGNENVKLRLLCFCDASSKAYATTIYLHQEGANETRSDLIFAKSRLAPVKTMTIPRLELMAVVIGVRCVMFVKENLALPISEVLVWSDSQCVLQWLASENVPNVFVKNRVREIKSTPISGFHYIASNENPADLATRGANVEQLIGHKLWWCGPEWLKQPFEEWRLSFDKAKDKSSNETKELLDGAMTGGAFTEQLSINNKELNKATDKHTCHGAMLCGNAVSQLSPFEIECENYSSASKLLRVTAFALRFIDKTKKIRNENGTLSKQEIERAETLWISHIQKRHYNEVIAALNEKKGHNMQRQLGLYIDGSGILRCSGRLDNAELSEAARHPILLPRHDAFTNLLIEKIHKELYHSGASQTLSGIRYKYWIPGGRAAVKSVLRQCLICRRHEGGAYKMPLMAPLPRSRVSEVSPFTNVGLDYLGPLYVKVIDSENKVWICLFTCLATRAVHLELMHNLSTDEFLMGLRRFIACRGKPDEIISDNAMQFKLASETIDIIWQNILKCSDVQNYASERRISWKFIVELAPWMGGFYERLVGLVKRSLRKAIGRKLLTESQMQTVIKEIESVVNTRPITYVGDDINSMITLSPACFLSLNPKLGLPEVDMDKDEEYTQKESSANKLFRIWKKGQKILNTFWKIWKDEYLLSLRERSQRCLKTGRIQSHFEPKVGDVVLVKDDTPRGCWRIGRISQLIESRDGKIRSAKVQIHTGRLIGRPLNLLYPIEVSNDIDQSQEDNVSRHKNGISPRPKRKAAEKAKLKIKNMLFQGEESDWAVIDA